MTVLLLFLILSLFAHQRVFAEPQPELISLTPECLRQIYNPADYFEDVSDLDGAVLFYAPGNGAHISALEGARVGIVAPYNTVYHKELYNEELKCVWGSLDVYSCSNKKDDFWDRPSNVFYSLSHVANMEGKVPENVFALWGTTHSKSSNKRKPALEKGKDFCSCPWYNTLDVKVSASKSLFYLWLEKWQSEDIENEMNNWRKRWTISDSFSKSRKNKTYAFSSIYSKTLNLTTEKYDGLLGLKSAELLKDFPVKEDYSTRTLYHMVPFCALTQKFTAPPMYDDEGKHATYSQHLLKAVIISDKKAYVPMYVLAICFDWSNQSLSSDNDALPINAVFSAKGGVNDTNLVPKPEYTRVPRSCFSINTLTGEILWKGGNTVEIDKNIPCAEIAIPAHKPNMEFKAVIAIPSDFQIATSSVSAKWVQVSTNDVTTNPAQIPIGSDLTHTSLCALQQVGKDNVLQDAIVTIDGKEFRLCVATMRAEKPFTSLLRQGRMEYIWYYYSSDKAQPIAADGTSIQKVSSVIGPSSWHVNGDWQSCPDSYENSVLLWGGVCDFFYEKMFDFRSRVIAAKNRAYMGQKIFQFAPYFDDYFESQRGKVDFRKTVSIGMLNNFVHKSSKNDNDEWVGDWSIQYRVDENACSLPSILYISNVITSVGRTTLNCFETSFVLSVVTRIIGDVNVGVMKYPGTHAWNSDGENIYDAYTNDYDSVELPVFYNTTVYPEYTISEKHEEIILR